MVPARVSQLSVVKQSVKRIWKKGLPWLTVSEASVHAHLASVLWTCGGKEWAARKVSEGER